ncbi:uncharacterized protein LOC107775033 [Nicotiana tabacum]|uniref:Uncharacterized protein LOC107775033 n=1 Tax=Nicotiana tabacum TaxID=4097 RepID=A0A1S3YDW7_TOBAC|nr:PREDICTED: uncharacterized protein LOC107775033 [Nicotiana tabacum]
MKSFSETIVDLQLMDLPLQGAQYTRGEDIFQASRIDIFLVSLEWNESFNVVRQLALPRVISDHKPLLWQSRFCTNPEAEELEKRYWNREVFGKLDTRRSRALDELSVLEQATENRAPDQLEKQRFIALKMELEKIANAEETSWRQKSRYLWLKEGDRNTRYFHTMANSHRRYNSIDKLKIGDEITDDKELIKREILNYDQNLYKENEEWKPTSSFDDVASLPEEERKMLEQCFEEEEVHAII